MERDVLIRLSCEFREALDFVVDNRLYGRLSLFQWFPKGCCRYTSDLLATYLTDNGIAKERIQVLDSETYKCSYTHCWIMVDEKYFVDVTADQFNGKPYFKKYEPIPKCCVVPRETYFYERFDNQKTDCLFNVGIESYSGDIPRKLLTIYNEIVSYIQNKR